MSLILDALRKSEAERRRGQSPDLYGTSGSSPAVRREGFRHWPILAGGALVLIAVATLFWPHAPSNVVPAAPPVATDGGDGDEAVVDPGRSAPPAAMPAPPVPAAMAPRPEQVAAAVSPAAAQAQLPMPPAPVQPAPTTPIAAVPTPASVEPAPPMDDLPTLAILAPGERAALPPLKLSMHVWNSDPVQRFAIVDGQRLTEGATIGGAVVAEIRRDGVVLDVNGHRVLLPRP